MRFIFYSWVIFFSLKLLCGKFKADGDGGVCVCVVALLDFLKVTL